MHFSQAFKGQLENSTPIVATNMSSKESLFGRPWQDGDIVLFFFIKRKEYYDDEEGQWWIEAATDKELNQHHFMFSMESGLPWLLRCEPDHHQLRLFDAN